jgi:hypothetical protein
MASALGKEALDLLFLTMPQDQLATIVSQTLKDIAAKKDKKTIGAVNLALTNKVMGGYDKAVSASQRGELNQEALTAEIAGRIEIKKLDAQRAKSVIGATSEARLVEIKASGEERRATLRLQDELANPAKYVKPSEAAMKFGTSEVGSLLSHLSSVEAGKETLLPLEDTPLGGEGWSSRIKRLEAMGEPVSFEVPALQAMRTQVQAKAVADTQKTVTNHFAPRGGVSDSIRQQIRDAAEKTGHAQTPASESFKAAKQSILMENAMLQASQKAGMALTPEGELVNKGVFSKMFGDVFGDRPQASAMLNAIRAKGGTPDPGALAKAMEVAKGSRLAKAGVGGVLAAVLLPMLLSRGKGEEQQDIPLPLKIQLMQTMANQQNQSALIQSLVGSRAAGAEKDQASAELLRLKAMAMMPQGGGGIL